MLRSRPEAVSLRLAAGPASFGCRVLQGHRRPGYGGPSSPGWGPLPPALWRAGGPDWLRVLLCAVPVAAVSASCRETGPWGRGRRPWWESAHCRRGGDVPGRVCELGRGALLRACTVAGGPGARGAGSGTEVGHACGARHGWGSAASPQLEAARACQEVATAEASRRPRCSPSVGAAGGGSLRGIPAEELQDRLACAPGGGPRLIRGAPPTTTGRKCASVRLLGLAPTCTSVFCHPWRSCSQAFQLHL